MSAANATVNSRAERKEELQSTLYQAYIVARCLRGMDLAELDGALRRAESVAPLLTPEAWMRHGQALSEDASVVRILARAKRDLDALPWPADATVPTR